jgi:hypothetical protein
MAPFWVHAHDSGSMAPNKARPDKEDYIVSAAIFVLTTARALWQRPWQHPELSSASYDSSTPAARSMLV